MNKNGLILAALGVAGVGAGAFGAHALKDRLLAVGMLEVWETAVFYHLLHTVALLGWLVRRPVAAAPAGATMPLGGAGLSWVSGILLFSGSLYALALGGPRWLGPVTPVGGLALMLGWLLAGLSLRRPDARP